MKINSTDYLVLKIGTKNQLVRCTKVIDGSQYSGTLDSKNPEEKPEHIKFEAQDVIANLGRAPAIGSVYGQKIEPMVKRLSITGWEEVHLYQHLDDAQEEELSHELSVVAKKLRQLGVAGLNHIVEVRQPSGKYGGSHKFQPKSETDILCVKPISNLEGLHYLMFHEYAHGIWHRMLSPKTRMRWVQLYHEYIHLEDVQSADLAQLLEEIESHGSISVFMRDCDDRSLVIVKDVLRHIQHVHGLNKKHLELLLDHEEDLECYWPASLELSEKETCLTEYARKSPEELFAESLAFNFCGRLVPKKIQTYIDKTLSNLIRQSVPTKTQSASNRKK